jgi:hypothetical protein
MLSIAHYDQAYIDACREKVDRQLDALDELAAAAAVSGDARVQAALALFEPRFCNHMLLALDEYFCHRARGKEGKDGNPLNEVRVLANSIMSHDCVLTPDATIRLDPSKSVLKHADGEDIALRATDVRLLSEAFFTEIETKYR